MADSLVSAYQKFLADRGKDVRRISSHTRGEYSLADVQQEAWVVGSQLALDRGREVADFFREAQCQDLLLAHLYQHLVRYRERRIRYAVRLDQPDDEGPDRYDLVSQLPERETSEPLARLLGLEEAASGSDDPDPLESVAAAYLHLLRRYGGSVRELAGYLLISVSHCYRCCARARILVQWQWAIPQARSDAGAAQSLRRWRQFRILRPNTLKVGPMQMLLL